VAANLFIDQGTSTTEWVHIGAFDLAPENAWVVITAGSGTTVADAVKLVWRSLDSTGVPPSGPQPGEQFVDDQGPHTTIPATEWESFEDSAARGGKAHRSLVDGWFASTVFTYAPVMEASGVYRVEIWLPSADYGTANGEYEVFHFPGGTPTRTPTSLAPVNWSSFSGGWAPLEGSYTFTEGAGALVELFAEDAGVVADDIRLVKIRDL
jgi:hypothetical protein